MPERVIVAAWASVAACIGVIATGVGLVASFGVGLIALGGGLGIYCVALAAYSDELRSEERNDRLRQEANLDKLMHDMLKEERGVKAIDPALTSIMRADRNLSRG